MTSPVRLDELARESCLLQLEQAHDHFVAVERRQYRKGNHVAAEGAHRVSVWLLRAYAIERDDTPPPGLEP